MLKNSSSVKTDFIKEVIDVLNIGNFDIEVIEVGELKVEGFEDGMCSGYNEINSNAYKCRIVILGTLPDEEKEITMVHELCHLVNRDFRDAALNFSPEAVFDFMIQFDERATESFAQAIYKLIKKAEPVSKTPREKRL